MSERENRSRVLIVAFHYAPDLSSSGVLRTLKYSRYLPSHGWLPTVLTVRPEFYETKDSALEKQIPPEVEVHRTRVVDMKRTFSIKGKHFRFMVVPDRFTGWLPFAVLRGRKLIREKKIDAIYSTSPIPTSHLVAMTLKRMTGIPWAADFRDPWLEPELANTSSPLYRFEERLHKNVLKHADRLIFTTQQLSDYVLRDHPEYKAKASVIPNGYDEADFGEKAEGRPEPGKITITHTGLVDGSYRSPRGVLEALSTLIARGRVSPNEVSIKFLGPGGYVEGADFSAMLDQLKVRQAVETTGKISYSACLAEQARSHALLLLQCGDDTRSLIPAKAFEYLRVGRPVLAVTPEGATSELFRKTGGAAVVSPDDQEGMLRALSTLVEDARAGRFDATVDRTVLESYSRRNLAGRLAQELSGMVSAAKTKRTGRASAADKG